jgi:hypothetical protein
MEDKLKSTASKLLEKAEERAKEQERLQEELKELKNEFNAVFGTKAGIKVARMMMKLSGIYNVNKTATDPVIMGEHRGMAKMYLVMIKGMLKADLIAEIERPNLKGEM